MYGKDNTTCSSETGGEDEYGGRRLHVGWREDTGPCVLASVFSVEWESRSGTYRDRVEVGTRPGASAEREKGLEERTGQWEPTAMSPRIPRSSSSKRVSVVDVR